MSTLYNVEPQPTAKVLLQTTSGDILLELFAKQTPLASRNFVQLCLDGYYCDTIFHRLVPGFIIQGGDPTGTGEGGDAIYDGSTFADEFHSRLRFNRRGLLGMANGGQKDDNGSQFFLTLGVTKELEGKHTMFGRVVGDTIFNLMRMGEAELTDVEGSERPLYPTKITGTEVLVNPFEGMLARKHVPKALPREQEPVKKKVKKKAGKALLSFGEEGDEVEEPVLKKAKFNPKLVASGADNGGSAIERVIRSDKTDEREGHSNDTVRTAELSKNTSSRRTRRRSSRSKSPNMPARQNTHPETQLPLPDEERPSRSSPSSTPSSPEPEQVGKISSLLDRTNAQIEELKASMKRHVPAATVETRRPKSALEQLIPQNVIRGRKRKQGGHGLLEGSQNDEATLKMLNAFRARLDQAILPTDTASSSKETDTAANKHDKTNGVSAADEDEEARVCDLHFIADCQSCQSWDRQEGEDGDDDDPTDRGWMSHALSFEKDRLGKDLNWKKKNEEELVVIDPREKAKEIKEEQRAKRQGQGNSRAWDRDRDRGRLPERLAGARG